MAGNLERIFEKWQSSLSEPDDFIWIQSSKNKVDLLFRGDEISISFPFDVSDIKQFVFSNRSNDQWIANINKEIQNDPSIVTFTDVLNMALTQHDRKNQSIKEPTKKAKHSNEEDNSDEADDDSNNVNDDDEQKDMEDEDGEEDDDKEEEDEEEEDDDDDDFDMDDDNFENDQFQEALQTLKMKKIWAKKDQEIRSKLGEKKNSKVKTIFSSDAAFGVLTNDLFSIMQNVHSLGFSAQPIDDNIYFWSVKIFGFDPNSKVYGQLQQIKKEFEYDYVELQVLFTEDLYPFYPPTIKIIRPRLQGFLLGRITHLDILKLDNWNPVCDMRYLLNHLKDVIEKHGSFDVNNPMNALTSNGSYSSLEHFLLRLEILSGNSPRANLKYGYDVSLPKLSTSNKPSTTTTTTTTTATGTEERSPWAKGTGYGRGQTQGVKSGWNVEAFLAAQKERDSEIISLVNAIEGEIRISNPPFDVLEESCLLPFIEAYCRELSLMDLERHSQLFNAIFKLISTLLDKDQYISLFSLLQFQTTSLGDHISECSKQVELFLKRVDQTPPTLTNSLTSSSGVASGFSSIINSLTSSSSSSSTPLAITPSTTTAISSSSSSSSNNNQSNLELQRFIIIVSKKMNEKLKQFKDEIAQLEANRPVLSPQSGSVGSNESIEKKYCQAMKPLLFDTADLKTPKSNKSSTQSRTIRIAQEQGSMMKSLPLSYESSIFVRVDEKNIDVMQCLITGPKDTPYSGGCFLFNCTFPQEYPASPPHVIILTTGGGSVRFNPNLYNNGKVCLSLLGTWSGGAGETWNPNTSTLLQVFISIQSLILVSEPFFNEPGYESQIGTKSGMASSSSYNHNLIPATIQFAMIDMIQNPPLPFKEVIHAHFYYQKNTIKKQCEAWISEFKEAKKDYAKILKLVNTLNDLLNGLKEPVD
ncbi:hypothetical protein ACTFIU_010893 [Dictyostelium citrinum]